MIAEVPLKKVDGVVNSVISASNIIKESFANKENQKRKVAYLEEEKARKKRALDELAPKWQAANAEYQNVENQVSASRVELARVEEFTKNLFDTFSQIPNVMAGVNKSKPQ